MQKIYINGHFLLTKQFSGVERFAYEMLRAIDSVLSENQQHHCSSNRDDGNLTQWIVVIPTCGLNLDLKQKLSSLNNIKILFKGFSNRHLFQQVSLPLLAKTALLLNFCNTGAILKRNQLVVLHDALIFAYPQAYTWKFRYFMQFVAHANAKFSKCLVTVSKFSQREIAKYTKRPLKQIEVIHCGYEHCQHGDTDDNVLKQHQLVSKQYILFVCSQSGAVYKNLQILTAMKQLLASDITIVVAGYFAVEELPSQIQTNFIMIKNINTQELTALYKHARCFVAPSLYEGFGLPPLEAMINGCPVILANIEVFHEIYQDAALYFNPYEAIDLSKQIDLLCRDDNLRNCLITKGLNVAKQYSWRQSAIQLLACVYDMSEDR